MDNEQLIGKEFLLYLFTIALQLLYTYSLRDHLVGAESANHMTRLVLLYHSRSLFHVFYIDGPIFGSLGIKHKTPAVFFEEKSVSSCL